jgi:GntR family transcriptional regulator
VTEAPIADLAARMWSGRLEREGLVTRVCDALRGQIADHALPPGTRLPGEAALADALKVSRPTLREATRILAREGLLDIRHGVGTFVAASSPHLRNALDLMSSLSAAIRAAGRVPGVRHLLIEQAAPPFEVAQALETAAGGEVVRISRVRLVDGAPLALAAEYLVLNETLSFERVAAFSGGSLYDFLIRDLGLKLLRSEMSVAAVSATAQQAKELEVKRGAPLLLMREIHFGEGDQRLLYSVNHHNSAVIDLTLARSGLRA